MLQNFNIDNFGKIKKISLNDLTKVNILTGGNGSGKSLVLGAILKSRQDALHIKDCLDIKLLSQNTKTVVLDYLDNLYLGQDDYEHLRQILPEVQKYYAFSGPERGGRDKLIKLCKLIYKKSKYENLAIFLLEEPELHLHPELQKEIPLILNKLAVNLNIQFFVETHSPFVISSSSVLVNFQEKQSRNFKSEFCPDQKVYFLKNGQIADKNGQISSKGSYGYWGSKVNSIASRMLGAGLIDFISDQQSELDKNSPYLIFCEGQGKEEDAIFYNTVFHDRLPHCLFVSSRGSSQLLASFQLLREIRTGLAADFKLLMVRDRDHEFRDYQEILTYQKNRPGVKVLHRRAIECYIYNSEIIDYVYTHFNQNSIKPDTSKLLLLERQIQQEAESGVKGSAYKNRLKESFMEMLEALNLETGFHENLVLNLARLVTSESLIYKELEQIIFFDNPQLNEYSR